VFGKCIENVRKQMSIILVSNKKKAHRLMMKANFNDRIIYSKQLMAINLFKKKI
jgi:hypothetical protein